MVMPRALILIKTKSQMDTELYDKVKIIPGVIQSNMIYGPYDIYTLCENQTNMGIKKLVIDLRNLPGVVSTLTCLVSE
jgi:hypothetical protein